MNLAILLDIPDSFIQEATFTIENLFFPILINLIFVSDLQSLKKYQIRIVYCHENSVLLKELSISEDTLFIILENQTLSYYSSFKPYNVENVEWINSVPFLFPLKVPIETDVLSNVLNFDIFAATFFFLSCWQEYYIKKRDEKGRIPLKDSIQYKLKIIRTPTVNQYLFHFINTIKILYGNELNIKPMPGGDFIYTAISHDVDHIDWPVSEFIRATIRNRHKISLTIKNLMLIVRNLIGKKYIFNFLGSSPN